MSRKTRWTRRRFIGASAALSLPWIIPAHVLGSPQSPGANERIRVGLIGTGFRSRDLLKESPPDLDYVSLADCDLRQITTYRKWAQETLPGRLSDKCPQYQDYREMFDKEQLDGVVVATTTHARTLICLHAMQAGLDVYAEKPLTLTIEEGQYLVRAEQKYGRVFQTGTQQRSIPINNFGSDLVKNGAIGRVLTVECPNFIGPELRTSELPSEPTPSEMDWDKWCHQTALVPYSPSLHPGLGSVGPLARVRRRRIGLGRHGLGSTRVRSGAARVGDRRHRSGRSLAGRRRTQLSCHPPLSRRDVAEAEAAPRERAGPGRHLHR